MWRFDNVAVVNEEDMDGASEAGEAGACTAGGVRVTANGIASDGASW